MMKKTGLILILWSFFTLGIFAQSSEEYFKDGMNKEANRQFLEAIDLYTKAIEKSPDNPKYYTYRGRAYYYAGNGTKAFEDLIKATEKDKEYALAFQFRAIMLLDMNRPVEAIRENDIAINFAENDTVRKICYLNRGLARKQVNDLDGAIADYKAAIKIDPVYFEAYTNLASAYTAQEKYTESIEASNKAKTLLPNHPAPYVSIGFAQLKMEHFNEAIASFNKALSLNPKDALSLNNRGFARLKLGKTSEALADINKSIELMPYNSYAYKNRALVYLELKDEEQACIDLDKAMQLGFTTKYGMEVAELVSKHCGTQEDGK